MARVFIATLGTNAYIPCNYVFNKDTDKKSTVADVRFIQEAAVRHYCRGWEGNAGDRVHILCTGEATRKNWADNGHDRDTYEGLGTRLDWLVKEEEYAGLDTISESFRQEIPEGNSEKEIWQIFDVVFNLIRDNDEVYFDITHGFRSLPMLAMVVLQYARQLRKNISIVAVSYGAFETLGAAHIVREIELSKRNAPVFDLTDFVRLMDWTTAAKDFISYGQTADLTSLLKEDASGVLRQGRNETAIAGRQVADTLANFSEAIRLNNLQSICSFNKLSEKLTAFKTGTSGDYPAFVPVIAKIEGKIQEFRENDLRNVFTATRWCISHGMYQNAYSILLEGVISIVLDASGQPWRPMEIDGSDSPGIEKLRSVPIAVAKKMNEDITEISGPAVEFPELAVIVEKMFSTDVARAFSELNSYRNSYMHCGTGSNSLRGDMIPKLNKHLVTFEEWYKGIQLPHLNH